MKIIHREWTMKLTQEEKDAILTTAKIIHTMDESLTEEEWDDICDEYTCALDDIAHDLSVTLNIIEWLEKKNLYTEEVEG